MTYPERISQSDYILITEIVDKYLSTHSILDNAIDKDDVYQEAYLLLLETANEEGSISFAIYSEELQKLLASKTTQPSEVELFDMDTIAVDDYDPVIAVIEHELIKNINILLHTLTEREEFVLRHRYGLDQEENPKTLKQIGDLIGRSQERIRQIEAKALRKLRHPSRSKKLFGYVNEPKELSKSSNKIPRTSPPHKNNNEDANVSKTEPNSTNSTQLLFEDRVNCDHRKEALIRISNLITVPGREVSLVCIDKEKHIYQCQECGETFCGIECSPEVQHDYIRRIMDMVNVAKMVISIKDHRFEKCVEIMNALDFIDDYIDEIYQIANMEK